MKDDREECMFRDCLNDGWNLSCLVIAIFSFAILYIMALHNVQVGHLYACLQDCGSSSIVARHQH
jgi:hypothetical protein